MPSQTQTKGTRTGTSTGNTRSPNRRTPATRGTRSQRQAQTAGVQTPYGSRRIGILGEGDVGSAIERGLTDAGYEVRTSDSDPQKVRDVAEWCDLAILAVPYGERQSAIQAAGKENFAEKTLVDVTNALDEAYNFAGSTELSGAEEVADLVGEDCCVVKAFNTTFANTMDSGKAQGEPLTLFCAGDDPQAKEEVVALGRAIGFDAVDAGPLRNARFLEPLGYLNMQIKQANKNFGNDVGFRYVYQGAPGHARPSTGTRRRTEPRRRVNAGRTNGRRKGKTSARRGTTRRT